MLLKANSVEFVPAPEGLHHAVCVDVVDMGLQPVTYKGVTKMKPLLKLIWQIEEINDKTEKRHMVSQRFTQTLSSKGNLRPLLEAWRGKKFTEAELQGFDPDILVGANCQVQVVHNIGHEGTTWANVQAVVPAPRGAVKLRSENYIRVKDRTDDEGNGNGNGHNTEHTGPAANDDDTPF